MSQFVAVVTPVPGQLAWSGPPSTDSASDEQVLRLTARWARARARLLEAEQALAAAGLEIVSGPETATELDDVAQEMDEARERLQ